MSERVQNRSKGRSPTAKAERRLAAQLAAQKAAEAKRRRQTQLAALAGLAVIAVIVSVFVFFGGGDDPAEQANPSTGPSATAPADAGFPPLPEGADPALRTKPAASAGTDELTKLTVTPLVKGTGPTAQAGQQVTVNYVGVSYRTGEEFDSSWSRSEPFSFALGAGQVIKGWDQGLVGVNVGSRIQLDIPSELAYGDQGRVSGPLRFVVDVLAVG